MKAYLIYKIIMFIVFLLLAVAVMGKPMMNVADTLQNVADTLQLVSGHLQ